MVLYDGHAYLGLVLQVQPDSLKVLTTDNCCKIIKLSQVSKKIAVETKGISRKHMQRAPVVTDKHHNVITMKSVVKPTDPGPFQHCVGEVRGMHKNQLFLLI